MANTASKIDVTLCGCNDDDIKAIKDILKSYENGEFRNRGQGNVYVVQTFDEMTSEGLGFDLRENGKVIVGINGSEETFIVKCKEEDKSRVIEQVLLMFSGSKICDADASDYLPFLTNGCTFYWKRINENDELQDEDAFLKENMDFFAKTYESSRKNSIKTYYQITGGVSLVDFFELASELENCEWIDESVFQYTGCEVVDDILSVFVSD